MSDWFLLVVAGSSLATYITRFPLILLMGGERRLPDWLSRYMSFIAPSVLTALIVPSIFMPGGVPEITLSNDLLPASFVTAFAAYLSKNMLVTTITGICVMALLVYV